MASWRQELDVDNWVVGRMKALSVPFQQQRAMSRYLIEALKGSSKTPNGNGGGVPDLSVESWVDDRSRRPIPVLIEDKLGRSRLRAEAAGFIKQDPRSISSFASNGALYYARSVVASGMYDEAIAIGVAGGDEADVAIEVIYVFGAGERSYKIISSVKGFNFLESQKAFSAFLQNARLSDEERHEILVRSRSELQGYAKKLNRLMHDLNIAAAQRVLYVSGMLLAMQDIEDAGEWDPGLIPSDLKGSTLNGKRDGQLIVQRISNYLDVKEVPEDKKKLMLASFGEIAKDVDRDIPNDFEYGTHKELAKRLPGKSSVTKRIFTFLYEYVFLSIDGTAGHLDIMGEMYSEFLKYALGDGKEIGIVLTPPYVTKLMAELIEIHEDSKVMDLAAGSAGFLISAMELMVQKARQKHGAGTNASESAISRIKSKQLLGVELNAEMYALATTNMILRGDGSSQVEKADAFKYSAEGYREFNADRLLLNPPFSFRENGMPFLELGLRKMALGGRAAIIIQDSAGSGRALATNAKILAANQMIASIKMPSDLFQPMAGVQTSVYVFEHSGRPHDFDKPVRFIDFRNDGYKRSRRALYEVDEPGARYSDLVRIYKAGSAAVLEADWGDLSHVVVDAPICDSGKDWNFDAHQLNDGVPTLDDFRSTVSRFLEWEVNRAREGEANPKGASASKTDRLEALKSRGDLTWKDFPVGGEDGLFTINPSAPVSSARPGSEVVPVISNTSVCNGISSWQRLLPNNNGNVITFSDTTDSAETVFYQPVPFVGFSHVQIMTPRFEGLNRRRALFIITAFRAAIGVAYSYATKFNRQEAGRISINLPTFDGVQPAWRFMEEFIEQVELEAIALLQQEHVVTVALYSEKGDVPSADLDEFEREALRRLEDDEVALGSFDLVGDGGIFTYARGVRQTIQHRQGGAVPLVTAGADSWGIAGYISSGFSALFASNTITIDMFANVFYRSHNYFADDNVISLRREGATREEMLFLASAMQRIQKRGYDKQFRVETLTAASILLPLSAEGAPDWQFMRVVIGAVKKLVVRRIDQRLKERFEAARELFGTRES